MTFELAYTDRARKDIESLDRVAQKRIAKKIMNLTHDPLRISKKLIDPRIGTYRYRIGDYRVVFDLRGKTVFILRVGHRREIYR